LFKHTEDEYTKANQIIDGNRVESPYDFWPLATAELNKHFNDERTKESWRQLMRYHNDENYRARKIIKGDQDNIRDSEQDVSSKKEQLKKMLGSRRTLDRLIAVLGVGKYEVLGLIRELQDENYNVLYDGETYVFERQAPQSKREYKHYVGKLREFDICVLSDTHMCAKEQQLQFLNFVYDECVRRKIKHAYHCGDLTDGFYQQRPEQIYNLFKLGATEQMEYVSQVYPKRDGITTHIIAGNHDETFVRSGGFNIVKSVCDRRPDMDYLGIGYARVWLTPNCSMDLFHPLDGSSYATSYSGQKYMDSITGGDKPNILCTGHHHKALYFFYRNIHYFEIPAVAKRSSWQQRKRLSNDSGAWFLHIRVDEDGTVVGISPELIPQYVFVDNDY